MVSHSITKPIKTDEYGQTLSTIVEKVPPVLPVVAWQIFCDGTYESADVNVKAVTVDGPTMSRAAYGPSKNVALMSYLDKFDELGDL